MVDAECSESKRRQGVSEWSCSVAMWRVTATAVSALVS